jgi:hypothetical protein
LRRTAKPPTEQAVIYSPVRRRANYPRRFPSGALQCAIEVAAPSDGGPKDRRYQGTVVSHAAIGKYQPLQALGQRERMRPVGVAFPGWIVLRQGRMTVAENQMPEQKSMLVVRAPLSEDGWASIYFSSNDGRQMSEREWWHLKQLIELASKAFVKPEPKSQSAAAGG